MRRVTLRLLGAVLAGLISPAMVVAQGEVTGTVKGPSGAVLPGVHVVVEGPSPDATSRATVSDAAGHFQVTGLASGNYRLTFTREGFRAIYRGVYLNSRPTVDVTMEEPPAEHAPQLAKNPEKPEKPDEPSRGRLIVAAIAGAAVLTLLLVTLRSPDRRARIRSVIGGITREFFKRPAPGRRWRETVAWWDSRRLTYSLFVLFVGLSASTGWWITWLYTGAYSGLVYGWMKHVLSLPSVLAWSLFIMLMANAWYTGAWMVEIVLRVVVRDRWLWLGPVMLGAGVLFSTLFTIAMMYPPLSLGGGEYLLDFGYELMTVVLSPVAAWIASVHA